VSLLAGLVGPMVFRNVGDAKVSSAKAQLELFALALDQYRLDNDYYPTSGQSLEALRTRPGDPVPRNWRGPYLRKAVPLDPWGHPYVYVCPVSGDADRFQLMSYGRDGQPGGTGEDADLGT